MDFTKNKSSYPVQLVVRASRRSRNRNYTKRSIKSKFEYRLSSQVSIPEYYGKELKRLHKSKNHGLALCPFHDERNPSFSVNLETGAFFCFACGERGRDVISYHAKKYGVTYKEAAKTLGVWNE